VARAGPACQPPPIEGGIESEQGAADQQADGKAERQGRVFISNNSAHDELGKKEYDQASGEGTRPITCTQKVVHVAE
jgi:hypothetical protein